MVINKEISLFEKILNVGSIAIEEEIVPGNSKLNLFLININIFFLKFLIMLIRYQTTKTQYQIIYYTIMV